MKKLTKKQKRNYLIIGAVAIVLIGLYFINKDTEKEKNPSSIEGFQNFAEDSGFSCKIETEISEGESVNVLQCISLKLSDKPLSLFAIASGQQTASGSLFIVIEKTKGVSSKINEEIFDKGFDTEIYKGVEIRTVTEGNIETSIITTDKYVIASASTSNSKRVIKELIDQ